MILAGVDEAVAAGATREQACAGIGLSARTVARFRPAIDPVGSSDLGQCSAQLRWLWQAWQPASPVTAASRSLLPVSRTSLTSVQARLSAAGPR